MSTSALTEWALAQQDNWSGIKESDEKGESILRDYNSRMGVKYNPTDAWSAITISNAVMTNIGAEDRVSARKLGFNPTKSHSGYVRDAFRTNANSDYRYNRYRAERPGESNYNVGDILVKGRSDTKGWKYEDFAKAGAGYKSHGDIIVDRGEDENGEYVILGGGNISDTYKNERVYLSNLDKKGYKVKLSDTQSGVQLNKEEKSSPGELAAVEAEEVKKSTPWWNLDDEEEVVQQPVQQPQTYSNELPYDLLSTIPAEDQALLFGQQMFDEGGIVRPAGDPWEYKKDGDKYLTRKRGSDSWITATGLPEESIKSVVFKEIPVSDRVKEATASYTREKRSKPKSETPRRKEAWRDVQGVERPKTYREARADGDLSQDELESINLWTNEYGYEMDWDAPLTSENPFIETQEAYNLDPSKGGGAYIDPNTFMVVSRTTPGAVYKTKNQLEQMVESGKASYFDKAMSPIAYVKSLYDGEDMGVGQHWFSEDVLGMDRGNDSWGKIGVDFVEDLVPDLALGYVAPWTIPLTMFGTGIGMAANYGYNDAWKEKYGDQTGTQYIEKDIADKWQRTKNAYTDQQGKFKLDSRMKQDLGFAGDAIESIGQGIQTGANYVGDGLETAGEAISDGYDYVSDGVSSGIDNFGDWTGWYGDGGPKVKQRRGSRKNYDNKTWTPSGLQFPTSESSHLMMAEYDDDIDPSTGKPVGWVGFPSLFQDSKPYANDQDNWIQMSGENGWGSIYEEAKKRGEVYYFGEDKESAIAFGEGSWKNQLPDETIEKELTNKEVEEYRLGGYTVEEIK